jgi:pyruvate dehydrogenase E1 component alpha subunit|tara:strand:- start:132 stop:962 length:831 start_codon:yes stop_codon:yes gene_type:complete
MSNFRLRVFKKAALSRNFENETFKKIEQKIIQIPVYLSAGQEYISATIATLLEKKVKPHIFIQHRGHSTYLSFNGDPIKLIDELLGRGSGCANGMGGSASIQSKENNIFGHDGLMGSQVPIAVGYCYTTKIPTIVFVGDSAAEEDYVLSSIGWAQTKNLPILFVVEDNNLSILTEKIIRRNWDMHNVAKGFGMISYNISDDPVEIKNSMNSVFEKPILLNINTIRKYWHAGAGIDDNDVYDRYIDEMKNIGDQAMEFNEKIKKYIEKIWQQQLEKK